MTPRESWREMVSIMLVGGWLSPLGASGDGLERWHWRNPLPQGEILRDVSFAQGRFFAFGEHTALTSTNGADWSFCDLGHDGQLHALTWGNNVFVAVGNGGTVLTSRDGVSWFAQNSGTTNSLTSIVYGGGMFVAVGNGSTGNRPTVVSSMDGSNWVNRTPLGVSSGLHGVTHGNGLFVAEGAAFKLWISSDGISWTGVETGSCFGGGAAYGAGNFVAVGEYFRQNGNESIYAASALTSSDGINWTRTDLGTGSILEGVAFGNGRFVAIDFRRRAFVSSDGFTWTAVAIDTPDSLYGIAFGNGQFVAVGLAGNILSSTDGFYWISRRSGSTGDFSDLVYAQGRFLAVADAFQSSVDGRTWSLQPTNRGRAIAYGSGRFVAVRGTGSLASTNGEDWVQGTNGTNLVFNDVAYGGGQFVGAGFGGYIGGSSDGLAWKTRPTGLPWTLYGVTYGNGRFVAVGGELGRTMLLSSTDGFAWTNSTTGLTNAFSGNAYYVAHGNGLFVASGEYGPTESVLFISADGLRWTVRRPGNPIQYLAYGYGVFVGIQNGRIVTSRNGQIWVARSSLAPPIYAFAAGHGTFVGAGAYGAICQSDEVTGKLTAPDFVMDGSFRMSFDGLLGQPYRIERSTDLANWITLQTVTNVGGPVTITDTKRIRRGRPSIAASFPSPGR